MLGQHPVLDRRTWLQAGSIGLLGIGVNHVAPLRQAAASPTADPKARGVIYIFLSGGLSQHDSFDMKPHAPANIRGEFRPIETSTPGIQICEHLPLLAQRSHLWSLCRSLTHPSNDHSAGHHIMLTGRSDLPKGFNPVPVRETEATGLSIASVAGRRSETPKQSPACGGAARSARAQFAAHHSGPVRRDDGKSARSVVYRRVSVQSRELWSVPDLRVRSPGSAKHAPADPFRSARTRCRFRRPLTRTRMLRRTRSLAGGRSSTGRSRAMCRD